MADMLVSGRLPIVIGAVGHRHLERADHPAYREQIAALIADLRRRYPATPLRFISPLAEGADCLMAEEALAHHCELLVPLPMERAEYEKDFPDFVAGFRSLLTRIPEDNVFVMPPPRNDGGGLGERDRRYEAAGAFVAAHCHFLIALWDGIATPTGVGTGAVVHLKLHGVWPSADKAGQALDAPDCGPVFHIHARRTGTAQGAANVQGLSPATWIYPDETNAAMFALIFSRMDRFNADAARAQVMPRVPASAAGLMPELAERPAPDREIATAFGFADQLSGRYRNMTHRVLRSVLLMAAGLALTYEIYAEILPVRAVPIAYLLLFAAICLVYYWQRRVDAQGRYLDYRAVAEGLRVQFYWRVAGLRDDVCANYLRKQLDELRWIREALRGANAVAPPETPRMNLVVQHWIRGQSEFYRLRAALQARRHHRIERSSAAFIAAGLLATASLVVFWEWLEHVERLHRWVVLLMGFAPIAAALWEAYGEKIGLRTQANQYARFASVFRRAELLADRLAAETDSPGKRESERLLIRELGRESLMENGDWVLLLRERPIVVPKG
jgi:hypothetical protein